MKNLSARGTASVLAMVLSCLGLARATVDGTIVDAATGAPIPNATVKYIPGPGSSITDALGHFHLPAPAEGILRGSWNSLIPGTADLSGAVDARGKNLGMVPGSHARQPQFLFLPNPNPGTSATNRRHARAADAGLRRNGIPPAKAAAAPTDCAVSIEAAGYRPRETNCLDGGENRIDIAAATSVHYYPHIPVQLADGWITDDVKTALPKMQPLQDMLDTLAAKKMKEVHSLLIVKGGKLLVEEYYTGNADSIDFEHGIKRIKKGDIQWSRTQKHYLASCNKSITSMVVGLAMAKGGLPVNSLLSRFLPKYQALFTGAKAGITLEHALTMTMGFQWDEWAGSNLADMWATQDLVGYVLAKPNAAVPGSQWIYNSGGPNILLAAMENVVGDMARFGDSALFAPLGITDYRWEKQPTGQPEGSARMFMRPRDMAKLGLLYLKGGAWQGRQIVPADWVAASTKLQKSAKPKSPNDYGYLWWIRKATTPLGTAVDYYEAEGDGGQYIVVLPAQDMVVVFTGGNYGDSQTYDGQIGRFLAKGVLPAANL